MTKKDLKRLRELISLYMGEYHFYESSDITVDRLLEEIEDELQLIKK